MRGGNVNYAVETGNNRRCFLHLLPSGCGRARPHLQSHVKLTAFILLVQGQDDGFLMHKPSTRRQACPSLLVKPFEWAKLWEFLERHLPTALHRVHRHPSASLVSWDGIGISSSSPALLWMTEMFCGSTSLEKDTGALHTLVWLFSSRSSMVREALIV